MPIAEDTRRAANTDARATFIHRRVLTVGGTPSASCSPLSICTYKRPYPDIPGMYACTRYDFVMFKMSSGMSKLSSMFPLVVRRGASSRYTAIIHPCCAAMCCYSHPCTITRGSIDGGIGGERRGFAPPPTTSVCTDAYAPVLGPPLQICPDARAPVLATSAAISSCVSSSAHHSKPRGTNS